MTTDDNIGYAERSELEVRTDRFIEKYITGEKEEEPITVLKRDAEISFYSLLIDSKYEDTKNNTYTRINKDKTVEIFGKDDLTKTKGKILDPGFFYAKFDNIHITDMFQFKYSVSSEKKLDKELGIWTGAMLSTPVFALSAWAISITAPWLIGETALALLMSQASLCTITGGLFAARHNQKKVNKREKFLETYKDNLLHGTDAILAALGRYGQ